MDLGAVAVVLLALVASAAASPPTNNLVNQYVFSSTWDDTSGQGNTMTAVGGMSFTTDRFGNANSAAYFDGSSGYLQVASQAFPMNSGDSAISMWVRHDRSAHEAIVWSRTDDSDTARFHFSSGSATNDNRLYGDYRSNTAVLQEVVAQTQVTSLPIGQWTHIVVSRSGNTYTTWSGGVQTVTLTDPSPDLPTNTGWRLSGRSTNMFQGAIDDVRLYSRALTQTDVNLLFNEAAPSRIYTEIARATNPAPYFTRTSYTSGFGSSGSSNFITACGNYDHLGQNFIVKLEMGVSTAVWVDYFKPRPGVNTLCDMLTSTANHMWSTTEDGVFNSVDYYTSTGSTVMSGGSTANWPPVSPRQYLSFWGGDGSGGWPGGCCHQNNPQESAVWHRNFRLSITADPLVFDGRSPDRAGLSCAHLKANGVSQDGPRWIDPDGPTGPIDAVYLYCDMTTDGGGWTLVHKFKTGTNADNTDNGVNYQPADELQYGYLGVPSVDQVALLPRSTILALSGNIALAEFRVISQGSANPTAKAYWKGNYYYTTDNHAGTLSTVLTKLNYGDEYVTSTGVFTSANHGVCYSISSTTATEHWCLGRYCCSGTGGLWLNGGAWSGAYSDATGWVRPVATSVCTNGTENDPSTALDPPVLLPQSIENNNFVLTVEADRRFSSVAVEWGNDAANPCNYYSNGLSTYWTLGDGATEPICTQSIKYSRAAQDTVAAASPGCGFTRIEDTANNRVVFRHTVTIITSQSRRIDHAQNTRNQTYNETKRSTYTVEVHVPTSVAVVANAVNVTGNVSVLSAVNSLSVTTGAPYQVAFDMLLSSQAPYQLTYSSFTSSSDLGNSITVSANTPACVLPAATAECLQTFQFSALNIDTPCNTKLSLNDAMTVTFDVGCKDSFTGNCVTPSPAQITVSFTLQSSEYCPQTNAVTISAVLDTYRDVSLTDTNSWSTSFKTTNFVIGSTLYGQATVSVGQNAATLDTCVITQITTVGSGNKVVYTDGGTAIQTTVENGGGAVTWPDDNKEARFAIVLEHGTSVDLNTITDAAQSLTVQVVLETTYTTAGTHQEEQPTLLKDWNDETHGKTYGTRLQAGSRQQVRDARINVAVIGGPTTTAGGAPAASSGGGGATSTMTVAAVVVGAVALVVVVAAYRMGFRSGADPKADEHDANIPASTSNTNTLRIEMSQSVSQLTEDEQDGDITTALAFQHQQYTGAMDETIDETA